MKIDRAGVPFVAAAAIPATALMVYGLPGWGTALAAAALFFLFFFRDPDRRPPADPDVVVAPADGRVLHAGTPESGIAPAGQWQQISIFLSPLDVHVNRTPVDGRVVDVRFRPGRWLPAYDDRAAAVNERSEVWVDHDGQSIVFRQVVGVLARRVVCRLSSGTVVARGERFGIMKFGSRMDVFVPPSAVVTVVRGDRVRGGETILARLRAAESATHDGGT